MSTIALQVIDRPQPDETVHPEVPLVRPVTARKYRRLERILDTLIKRPHLVPRGLRLVLLRQVAEDECNASLTRTASEMEEYFSEYPAERILSRIALDAMALVAGFRLVPDEKINHHLRTIGGSVSKKKSLSRRLIEQVFLSHNQRYTTLIQESVDLAAQVEALKMERDRIRAENASVAQRAQETTAKTAAEASAIVIRAIESAEAKTVTAKRELARLTAENGRLTRQNAELERIRQEIIANPSGAEALRVQRSAVQSSYQDRATAACAPLATFSGVSSDFESLAINLEGICGVMDHLFEILESCERECGVDARRTLAGKLTQTILTASAWIHFISSPHDADPHIEAIAVSRSIAVLSEANTNPASCRRILKDWLNGALLTRSMMSWRTFTETPGKTPARSLVESFFYLNAKLRKDGIPAESSSA